MAAPSDSWFYPLRGLYLSRTPASLVSCLPLISLIWEMFAPALQGLLPMYRFRGRSRVGVASSLIVSSLFVGDVVVYLYFVGRFSLLALALAILLPSASPGLRCEFVLYSFGRMLGPSLCRP